MDEDIMVDETAVTDLQVQRETIEEEQMMLEANALADREMEETVAQTAHLFNAPVMDEHGQFPGIDRQQFRVMLDQDWINGREAILNHVGRVEASGIVDPILDEDLEEDEDRMNDAFLQEDILAGNPVRVANVAEIVMAPGIDLEDATPTSSIKTRKARMKRPSNEELIDIVGRMDTRFRENSWKGDWRNFINDREILAAITRNTARALNPTRTDAYGRMMQSETFTAQRLTQIIDVINLWVIYANSLRLLNTTNA